MTTPTQPQISQLAQQLAEREVQVRKVGDIYADHPYGDDGKPISAEDMDKWMVTVLAGSWPSSTIRAIPLAETAEQAWANACIHLTL